MSTGKKAVLWAVATPLLIIALLATATLVDGVTSSGRAARHVEVAGTPVGGKTRAEVTSAVEALSDQLPSTQVELDAGEFTLEGTAEAFGIGIDVDATVDDVMRIGNNDAIAVRPLRFIQSWFGSRAAPVVLTVDSEQLSSELVQLEGDRRTQPTEPTLEATADGVVLVPGSPGHAITVIDVINALPQELGDLSSVIEIKVPQTVTPPQMSDASVEELVKRANEITDGEVTLVAGKAESKVKGSTFRPAFGLATDGTTPRLVMNEEEVAKVFAEEVPNSPNPTGIRFDIQGGVPVPVGGEDAQVCCGPDAPEVIVNSLLEGKDTIELPTKVRTAAEAREWAAGTGVKEVIGSYTTNFKCCESRVTNIKRISDMLRGQFIAPGETFSVNQTVGRRTKEKGFAEGGVIQDGEFTTDIGGGVSQFATTLFNAAFFGGLDIPAYKAHSKYISRYPFGREATLSYPGVDLKIRNNTPYGIVIWPTYTNTSVTVDLWSTRTAVGEQTGQNKSSGCGAVTTTRTRTFTDGTKKNDTFRANYDCE